MKVFTCLILFTTGLLAAGPARAESPPTDNPATLHVTVVEPVNFQAYSASSDFDRLDLALERVAKQRKWPVKIAAEKLVSNTPDYDPEVRVVLQHVRIVILDEYVFKAWVTATLNGKTYDFKMVTYRYYPRMQENSDDAMEKIFLGGANAIAEKVEPLFFPLLKPRK